jgi:hypothetical protein
MNTVRRIVRAAHAGPRRRRRLLPQRVHWETNSVDDTDEFRYATMSDPTGEGDLAGIMDAKSFLPHHGLLLVGLLGG